MNIGEKVEILTKLVLIYIRDMGKVESVSIGDKECRSLPDSIQSINDIKLLNDDELISLAKYAGCYKSPSSHKADVIINGYGVSIKSLQGRPPAIINHTSRFGIERVCKYNCSVGTQNLLDEMVKEYHKLRREGAINEDICNDSINSPFKKHKDILKEVLNYFVFKGTGARDSKFPAKYILEIDDPFDTSTWKTYDENNFIDANWDKLVFSMRSSKGMGKYPNVPKDKRDSMSIWVEEHQKSKYSGAIHVRLKN